MRIHIWTDGSKDKPLLDYVKVYSTVEAANDYASTFRTNLSTRVFPRSIRVDTLGVRVWVVVREKNKEIRPCE